MHEPLDIVTINSPHRQTTEQRFDVSHDPPAIGGERAGLFGATAPCQQPPGFGVGEIQVAQLSDCHRLASSHFLGRRVCTRSYIAENPQRLLASLFRRPRGAMPSDYLPTLPPIAGAVFDKIGDRLALLTTRSEATHGGIPNDFAEPQRPHFPQADPLPLT